MEPEVCNRVSDDKQNETALMGFHSIIIPPSQNSTSGIPPPARFAAGSCTLPRGSTISAPPSDSRCGIPLQHLRTLPRPIPAPAPAPAPRAPPRDTPL